MKILSITAQKPHSTGSGTYLTELVKSFDVLGCKQAVIAGVYPDDKVYFPDDVSFYPVHLPFPLVGMSDIMPYESTRYRDMTTEMVSSFEAAFMEVVEKAVSEFNPDIIICHHLFYLTSLVKKSFPELTVYGICHGTCLRQLVNALKDAPNSPWALPIDEIIEEIGKLDRIYALHSEQAAEISGIFNIDNSKISVIGSGYNPELFNSADRIERQANDPVRICYAGKISTPKGIPEFLDALSLLEKQNISVTLVGGCLEPDILSRIEKLSSDPANNFSYLGALTQAELVKVYKQNDILVLPSYFEGLSLVPIEAMACGLIPVCTDLPGMRTWIDEMVFRPNIHYIPMPEMATIDSPTKSGRIKFVEDIASALQEAIDTIASGTLMVLPDTSKITWSELAYRIIQ